MQIILSRHRAPKYSVLLASASLVVTGCATETGQGAVGGAAIGALAGALIGGEKGVAIGTAIGAAVGAATGAYLQQRREQYASLEQMAVEEIRLANTRNASIAQENNQLQAELAKLNSEIGLIDADVVRTDAEKHRLLSQENALNSKIASLDALIEKTEQDIKDQRTIVAHLLNNEKIAEADKLNSLLIEQRDVHLADLRRIRAEVAQALSDVQAYI